MTILSGTQIIFAWLWHKNGLNLLNYEFEVSKNQFYEKELEFKPYALHHIIISADKQERKKRVKALSFCIHKFGELTLGNRY